MKADMIIREIYLGRTGKQSRGKRTEQRIRMNLCLVCYHIFTSIRTLIYLSAPAPNSHAVE